MLSSNFLISILRQFLNRTLQRLNCPLFAGRFRKPNINNSQQWLETVIGATAAKWRLVLRFQRVVATL